MSLGFFYSLNIDLSVLKHGLKGCDRDIILTEVESHIIRHFKLNFMSDLMRNKIVKMNTAVILHPLAFIQVLLDEWRLLRQIDFNLHQYLSSVKIFGLNFQNYVKEKGWSSVYVRKNSDINIIFVDVESFNTPVIKIVDEYIIEIYIKDQGEIYSKQYITMVTTLLQWMAYNMFLDINE